LFILLPDIPAMKIIHTYFLLVLILTKGMAQPSYQASIKTFQPEIMMGKNIPVYEDFPESNLRTSLFMTYGVIHHDTTKHWVSYYNYPTTGISMSYSSLGNRDVLSQEFSLLPFITLKTSRNIRKSLDFKLGLGVSYFTNPFHEEQNPGNRVIGSHFNWGFQAFLYKNLLVSNLVIIKAGLGFLHHSNAHTSLPNYGLNSAMFSLAAEFPTRSYDPEQPLKQSKMPIDRTKHYFIQSRYGLGFHELGGTDYPRGGPTYNIHTLSLSGGIIFKQQMKWKAGVIYRFYESFYEYAKIDIRGTLGDDHLSTASNVMLFTGIEFLINHVGIDIEAGINLHKPFYDEFNERWEFKQGFEFTRNKYISTRLGLNYYLINTAKMPRHNVRVGTHINANFGEADFMDISLGYTWLIK